MNVFDVLREKLKEKAEIYRKEEEIQKSNPCYQIGVYGFKASGYKDAIEIVNQVEQEYNNGWIPCSERLPEKNGVYLVTQKRYSIETKRVIGIETDYVQFAYGKWSRARFLEVIAWQPLPQKYEPKGE